MLSHVRFLIGIPEVPRPRAVTSYRTLAKGTGPTVF